MENKTTVTTQDVDGNSIELQIIIPGVKLNQEAQLIYNMKLSEFMKRAVNNGEHFISRTQLNDYLNKMGIWTREDQTNFTQLQFQIRDLELKLKRGGITTSEGRKIALEIRAKRMSLFSLYSKRAQFDNTTMESMAEQHKFKYLMSKCVIDPQTNQPYFNSLEDYDERQGEQAAIDCAKKLAKHVLGYDENFDDSLVENQWLKQYGYVNEKGQLVDKNNNLIDIHGRKINEDGRLIDNDGNLIDIDGNKVDENGNLIIDNAKPFIDDETQPKRKKQRKKSTKGKSKKSNK